MATPYIPIENIPIEVEVVHESELALESFAGVLKSFSKSAKASKEEGGATDSTRLEKNLNYHINLVKNNIDWLVNRTPNSKYPINAESKIDSQ